jgi:hypothetical protein
MLALIPAAPAAGALAANTIVLFVRAGIPAVQPVVVPAIGGGFRLLAAGIAAALARYSFIDWARLLGRRRVRADSKLPIGLELPAPAAGEVYRFGWNSYYNTVPEYLSEPNYDKEPFGPITYPLAVKAVRLVRLYNDGHRLGFDPPYVSTYKNGADWELIHQDERIQPHTVYVGEQENYTHQASPERLRQFTSFESFAFRAPDGSPLPFPQPDSPLVEVEIQPDPIALPVQPDPDPVLRPLVRPLPSPPIPFPAPKPEKGWQITRIIPANNPMPFLIPQPGPNPSTLNPDGTPKPAPVPTPVTTPDYLEIPWPGAKPIGQPSKAPRPDLVSIARELGRQEQKMSQIGAQTSGGGGLPGLSSLLETISDVLEIVQQVKDLLGDGLPDETYDYGPGSFNLAPVCERDSQGQPLPVRSVEWSGGSGKQNEINAKLNAIAELLQIHKDLRQPICRGTPPIGAGVTVTFEEVAS